jgi:hypothetical protein
MLEQGLIEESHTRPDPHLATSGAATTESRPSAARFAQAEAARMRDLVELAAARFGVPKHA